jgi:molybdate transport system substrate-binding protein
MRTLAVLAALAVVFPNIEEPLTVSAAVSLTESLEAIGKVYLAGGGTPVRFNFAGSNVLARQLVNGAPADVFISADEVQMDVAGAAGAIDIGSRVDLLGNRLAVIVRPDNRPIREIRELLRTDIRRVALGDPSAVPAGVYARQYLQAQGVWDAIEGKVVPVGNVRAAVAAVENGSADAAIVYETDAGLSRTAITALVVSGPGAPRIVYPAAIVSGSRQRDRARRFLSFLRGAKASAVFRKFRFIPLAPVP